MIIATKHIIEDKNEAISLEASYTIELINLISRYLNFPHLKKLDQAAIKMRRNIFNSSSISENV